jgi:hypothetical protein
MNIIKYSHHHPRHRFHHHLFDHIYHQIPHYQYISPVAVIVKITCHIYNGLCKPHNSAGTQDAAIKFQDAPASAPVLWIVTAHIARANKYFIPDYSVIFYINILPPSYFQLFRVHTRMDVFILRGSRCCLPCTAMQLVWFQ